MSAWPKFPTCHATNPNEYASGLAEAGTWLEQQQACVSDGELQIVVDYETRL